MDERNREKGGNEDEELEQFGKLEVNSWRCSSIARSRIGDRPIALVYGSSVLTSGDPMALALEVKLGAEAARVLVILETT